MLRSILVALEVTPASLGSPHAGNRHGRTVRLPDIRDHDPGSGLHYGAHGGRH
jgi:hypothetical protein